MDPTTASALAAVQTDVNQNEADSDQADADLQAELDDTQAGAGLGTDSFTANATKNYINAARAWWVLMRPRRAGQGQRR